MKKYATMFSSLRFIMFKDFRLKLIQLYYAHMNDQVACQRSQEN